MSVEELKEELQKMMLEDSYTVEQLLELDKYTVNKLSN